MDKPGELDAVPSTWQRPMQALPSAWSELASVLENLTEVFFTLDRQWCFTYLNAKTEEYLGRTRAELIGKPIWDECPHLRGTAYEAQFKRAAEQSTPCTMDLYDPARTRWKELQVFPSASGLAVSCIDISERRERQEAERDNALRFQVVARATTDVIFDWDVAADWVWWSDGVRTVFGYDSPEFARTFQGWVDHIHPDDRDRARNSFCDALRGDSVKWTGEYRFLRKDGSYADVHSNTIIVRDRNGIGIRAIGAMIDVTERKQTEQQILKLAFFDPLTHLPNRRMLLDRLGHALAACARTGRSGALLFLDLDNFKSLNDTLGHDKGDELLEKVACRLHAQVPRATDTVARHGGDEFVIVLEELSGNEQEAAAQAERVAEKILHMFESPFQLGSHQIYSGASVGIALFDKRITQVDEVLKRGDQAMYQAKGAGRNTARFFDQHMQMIIDSRVRMESDLRYGLQRGEFCLHYQRQANDADHTIGAEVLVRWMHPGGAKSPSMFVPLAEETGLILHLGHWVLETACRQLVAWVADPAKAGLTLAVNVSPRQFHQSTFVDEVLELLDGTGANPHRLKLELTESLLVENVEQTIEHMNALKASGISFALDDFGTGYSSLAYLKRLPLDQLKIDQSFVRDVLTDPNDAAIVRTIVGLGQTLGLDVIAEGVETQSQRDFLAVQGCRSYQGFFFGTPVTAEQF